MAPNQPLPAPTQLHSNAKLVSSFPIPVCILLKGHSMLRLPKVLLPLSYLIFLYIKSHCTQKTFTFTFLLLKFCVSKTRVILKFGVICPLHYTSMIEV